MIRVIRTDGMEILINARLMEAVNPNEEGGSVITLGSGEKVYIKNVYVDVLQKIDAYRQGLSEERRQENKLVKDKERGIEPEKEKPKGKSKERDKKKYT